MLISANVILYQLHPSIGMKATIDRTWQRAIQHLSDARRIEFRCYPVPPPVISRRFTVVPQRPAVRRYEFRRAGPGSANEALVRSADSRLREVALSGVTGPEVRCLQTEPQEFDCMRHGRPRTPRVPPVRQLTESCDKGKVGTR